MKAWYYSGKMKKEIKMTELERNRRKKKVSGFKQTEDRQVMNICHSRACYHGECCTTYPHPLSRTPSLWVVVALDTQLDIKTEYIRFQFPV